MAYIYIKHNTKLEINLSIGNRDDCNEIWRDRVMDKVIPIHQPLAEQVFNISKPGTADTKAH